ncbi:hypothetical protein C4A76_25240 [Brevibacillus laterosporus]|uniref:hypothetical protein n=1 Tax=Brevibacillus laterosporus TaxID=1465 RepID=UPI000CE490DE|nr:hypothetical protein [Brevibacillus laterosporus]PPA80809.1 hypothetical protein C4A76_25240 [Brevibacillus laterosporus]
MRSNTSLRTMIIVLIVFVAIIAYFTVWPWVMIFFGSSLLPNPPRPEITYGEFPFRLEYEIKGKRIVIQDTLICEYDGIGINEGQGKYREWKEHLASGKQQILLLKIDDSKEIYYDPGPAQYYMGDMHEGVTYIHGFPDARYFKKYADGNTRDGIIPADELLTKYNIKLKSWDYTQPIKNNFSATPN